ncbi:glycerophosphodiester phosphodiesterase family protein [Persicobacter sp. CCB-QB2]|uniref:glycerophosphodiester phosphodiesterase family protein n=1 Tax=Persicobacter sp. CCB-QB2 TaxID=1561025 RepID=UPI0006A9FC25|nr:glycerophosphodiester phosphodiesterase family protein [Persicobacter sp. CCB-QB2]
MKKILLSLVVAGLFFQACDSQKASVQEQTSPKNAENKKAVAKAEALKKYQAAFDRLNQKPVCEQGLDQVREIFGNPEGRVLVAAHRGDHMEMPENSLPSFEHSVKYGTDIIELDIRNSKEDSLMVIHDGTVNRTTNGEGKVSEMSYEQLRALKLIDEFTGKNTDLYIPTLYESLKAMKGKIVIDLDIKCDNIEAIHATVGALEMFDQCLFFCDEADMDYVLGRTPEALVMPRARSMESLEHLMEKYNPAIIHIDDSNFEVSEAVRYIKSMRADCRVWANALGKYDRAAIEGNDAGILKLMEQGIDVVQTDLPRYVQYLVCKEASY